MPQHTPAYVSIRQHTDLEIVYEEEEEDAFAPHILEHQKGLERLNNLEILHIT